MVLPDGWYWSALQDVCASGRSIVSGPFGSSIGKRFFVEFGVPVIRGNNLSLGMEKFSDEGFVFLTDEKASEFTSHEALPNDLIFTAAGTIGQVGLIPEKPKFEKYIISNKQLRARLDVEKINPKFAYYWFSSPRMVQTIQNRNTGSTIPLINLSVLRSLPIPVPSLQEQEWIVENLTALDDRITLLRETNKTLESIAQAIFKSWFVDFDPVRAKMEGRQPEGMDEATAALFPDSFEESELGLIPRDWSVQPLLDVCDLLGGSQPPASQFIKEPKDGYVRLLQIRDFSTDSHKTFVPDTAKLRKATEDDILIGRYGSASGDKSKDSLGRVCRGLSGAYNVALMKLSPLSIGKEFAFQLISYPRFYSYLQGVSSKAVQSGFSKSELAHYKVVVPSADLTNVFEKIGVLIWKNQKENSAFANLLERTRDAILPRLISGQLRLPEAEDLTETALS